jgi:hypothetical protein
MKGMERKYTNIINSFQMKEEEGGTSAILKLIVFFINPGSYIYPIRFFSTSGNVACF